MINHVSERIAKALGMYVERTTEVDYIRYGIEILIRGFIKIFILLTTSILLGLLFPMLSVLFTFIIFRFFTGGHHYSTYVRCLFAGLIIMLFLSFISSKLSVFIDFRTILVLLCFSIITGLFLAYKYAPSNHFYKNMTENQKRKLKKFSLSAIIIWGGVIYTLTLKSYPTEVILASLFGFLFQIGTIHPYSYLIVNKIEHLLERRQVS
ncbi:accessory gene regulator B family protein [Alkalihalobacillus sp. MEB130]|uniref:accessory gene regulator ArgB-like protein n=1 Tax=Alkalihalobacillus sp. MEB130 TaxID=2976704 RepID=UPI0028DDDBE0|nr:accessory gene regulator B family protein [Alkalihalobacillus sp. MEB130]MDT8860750.1 accessory gene regulator B family protein [Alkalihalobacillus sp. MEB130]